MCDQDLKIYERKIKARFYRWLMHTYGGLWERASDEVFALTGVNIPAESLRQNIEPVSKKSGMPPRRFKDLKRLNALKDFLISVNYLYEQELQELDNTSFVANALSDFINGEDKLLDTKSLEKFRGNFIGDRSVSGYTESIELNIDYVSQDKAVKVTELSSCEYGESNDLDDSVESEGWAVCNAQGFYILLLRNALTTKCYLVLQTSPSVSGDNVVNDMAIFTYESAWTGDLEKNVIEIHDRAKKTEYRLPKKIEGTCLFLTRA